MSVHLLCRNIRNIFREIILGGVASREGPAWRFDFEYLAKAAPPWAHALIGAPLHAEDVAGGISFFGSL